MKRMMQIVVALVVTCSAFAQINVWERGYLYQLDRDTIDSVTINTISPYDQFDYFQPASHLFTDYYVNPPEVNVSMQPVYDLQKRLYVGLEDFGYSRHNDFGIAAVCMQMESQGQDFVSPQIGYNWFSALTDWNSNRDTLKNTGSGMVSYAIWNTLYRVIVASNYVIAHRADAQYELAQARAMRAFAYMQLAQAYQAPYSESNLALPGVPLLLDTVTYRRSEIAPNATVGEVYAQIKADLDAACQDLEGFRRADKSAIDQAVTFGLRARLNLLMHNWAEAASDADRALELSGAMPLSIEEVSVPGFASADAHNVIWANIVNESDDIVQTGIINWVSHMSSFYTDGYTSVGATRAIANALYNEIPATDVRKGWWLDAHGESPLLEAENYRDIRESITASMDPYTNVKFGTGNDSVSGLGAASGDWITMRAEEMLLIKAEGLAKSGKDGASVLNEFVKKYRDTTYTVDAHGLSIEDEIWWQRRVELWGEGFAWGDLMRLNKPIVRTNSDNWPEYWARQDIPAGDPRMLMLHPTRVASWEALVGWFKDAEQIFDNAFWEFSYVDSISFGPAEERFDAYITNAGSGASTMSNQDSRQLTVTVRREHNVAKELILPLIVEADDAFDSIPRELNFGVYEYSKTITITIDKPAVGTHYLRISIPEEYTWYNPNQHTFEYQLTVLEDAEAWEDVTDKTAVVLDGLVNVFYGTGQPGWYVSYQRRDNEDGSFDIRLINPYTVLPAYRDGNHDDPIADEYGLYDGFPYNYPEDVDTLRSYNMTIHVDAYGQATFDPFEMGMTWAYGTFYGAHLSDRGMGYYDSYNQRIIFYAGTIACAMSEYRDGNYYLGSENMSIFLDKDKYYRFKEEEERQQDANKGFFDSNEFTWAKMPGGLHTFVSALQRQKKNAELQYCVSAPDWVEKDKLYRIVDAYEPDHCLAFYWDTISNTVTLPAELQPTGWTISGKMTWVGPSDRNESYVEDVDVDGVPAKLFHLNILYQTKDGRYLGRYEEQFYYSTDPMTVEAAKEDFVGDYIISGLSPFDGSAVETMVNIELVGERLVLFGIRYADTIWMDYDPENYTISIAPQKLGDYGQYDISLYTLAGENGVSAELPVVLAKGKDGSIRQTEDSPATGYLLRSEAAGGWVEGLDYFAFYIYMVEPALTPRKVVSEPISVKRLADKRILLEQPTMVHLNAPKQTPKVPSATKRSVQIAVCE